jgi:hypothetical protein
MTDDRNTEYFAAEHSIKIDLADMDYKTWRDRLSEDAETLELLRILIDDITPEHDTKLQTLFGLIEEKLTRPINEGNRKILIFTAFSDTAEYLYAHVSAFVKSRFGLDSAMVTGSVDGKTTIKGQRASMNEVLTLFSPISKDKELLMPNNQNDISVLIARIVFRKVRTFRTATIASNTISIGIPYVSFSDLGESTVLEAGTPLFSL